MFFVPTHAARLNPTKPVTNHSFIASIYSIKSHLAIKFSSLSINRSSRHLTHAEVPFHQKNSTTPTNLSIQSVTDTNANAHQNTTQNELTQRCCTFRTPLRTLSN